MNTARRALNATEIVSQLSQLNGTQAQGWRLVDDALEKIYGFKNFFETMGFVNAVAFIVNQQDHHPEMRLSYKQCVVRFNTHDINGISMRDFDCATRVDALLS